MTLKKIGAFIIELISGWQNPTSLDADLADLVLTLNGAQSLGVSSPLVNAAYKIATQSEAGLANIKSGQAATVAHEVVDGIPCSLVLIPAGGPAATAVGL
jgi:hypothetical protein